MKLHHIGFPLITFVLLIQPAFADIYKCEIDGVLTFSQFPCSDSATLIEVKERNSINNPHSPTSDEKLQRRTEIDKFVEIRKLERKIKELVNKRKEVLIRRDEQLGRLRADRNRAANNLAGATWERSLAEEMSAVSHQAETEIASLDRQISSVESELISLSNSDTTPDVVIANNIQKQEDMSSFIHLRQLERDKQKLVQKRRELLRQRDKKIEELRQNRQKANNNLAGATWETSLAEEMTAVAHQADTDIVSIDRQIASIEQQISRHKSDE